MSRRGLGTMFGACLGLFLLISVPIQVPASFVVKALPGVAYTNASGTLWRGQLEGLHINAVRAGDVRLSVSALHFFLLRAGVSWSVEGLDMAGEGSAWQSLLGGTGLQADRLEVSAGAMLPWLPIFGTVEVSDLDLVMARSGCQRAAGQVTTDVLERSERTLNWRGPRLTGSVECQGSDLVLSIAGEDGSAGITARAALKPDGSFQQDIAVRTEDSEIGLGLMTFGFTAVDDAYRLRMIGRWRG